MRSLAGLALDKTADDFHHRDGTHPAAIDQAVEGVAIRPRRLDFHGARPRVALIERPAIHDVGGDTRPFQEGLALFIGEVRGHHHAEPAHFILAEGGPVFLDRSIVGGVTEQGVRVAVLDGGAFRAKGRHDLGHRIAGIAVGVRLPR